MGKAREYPHSSLKNWIERSCMKIETKNKNRGRFFIFTAYIGILFSIFGIATTWFYKPKVENTVLEIIESLDQILDNTNDGLIIVENTLKTTSDNIGVITGTLENASNTLDNISVSLTSSADLIGKDLHDTIIDTQTALISASQSAGIIDNTLKFIAGIPLLGADYRPDEPLGPSLLKVSESLNDAPDKFLDIQQYIQETDKSMGDLQTNISELSEDIENFEMYVEETQTLLSDYRLIFENIKSQFQNIREQIPIFLLIASILLTGGFFLLGIAQLNLYHLGKAFKNDERPT